MHCVIATSGAASGLRAGVELQTLLRDWQVDGPDLGGDPASLETPFERTLATSAGLTADAPPPLAAWAADAQGLTAPAWAWLSPLHLQLDAQQAIALPNRLLALDETEGRALFATLAPLFPATEGWQFHYVRADQWLLGHEQFVALQLASLHRIAQRPLTPWLPQERWLRRLQNEAQMLLHAHPLNQDRAQRGALTANSVWLWGTGNGPALPADLVLHAQAPLDDAEQPAHWQRLDSGPIAALRQEAAAGRPARLTLAGDVRARSWVPAPKRWAWPWQRRQTPDLLALLQELDQ